MNRLLAFLAAGALLAGCGSETGAGGGSVSRPTAIPAADGPVETLYPATIMDTGRAELCLGAVAESYPPQCGGPPITNWNWADHEGSYEQQGDVRWGEFHVVGSFDGERFTVTEVTPADEYEQPDVPEDNTDLSTPCPDPEGWSGGETERVSPAALDQAGRVARKLSTYGSSWVDRSRDLRTLEEMDQDALAGKEDVSTWIFNVAVTDELDAAEAAVREVWDGALCVSRAEYPESRLMAVRRELDGVPGLQSMGSFRVVDLGVLHDDGSIQAWVNQEYGEGLVRVSSALVPAGD